ncbi:zinc ribbon-containing protein [Idiomarina sp. HP20-50]|uniref:zinc ribbon-containing protein n=1 Tax=Idiomarina sp. HP20-50 TaxID=3070813 RepID=UPI003982763B
MLYDIGEKPGKGTYQCTSCNKWEVTLDDGDRLPPCGECGSGQNIKYKKIK